MTLIELFRENSFQNVVSALTHKPRLLVYLISPKALAKYRKPTEAFFENKKTNQKIIWYPCNTDDLNCLISTLERIVFNNPDCVADVNGSEGLMLLALGRTLEKHPDKLKTLNSAADRAKLAVAEMISLSGGSLESSQNPDPQLSEKLWSILKKDPDRFNRAILELNTCMEKASDNGFIFEKAPGSDSLYLLDELEKLSLCTKSEDKILLKHAAFILKAGNTLEARVLWALSELCDDAVMGANLDWDGQKLGNDTSNEIDVLASLNARLIFISCKNGSFDENELYKLAAVSSRFGSEDSLKAIVATAMGKLSPPARQRLEQRARDMGITLISGVHKMNDEDFKKAIKELISR